MLIRILLVVFTSLTLYPSGLTTAGNYDDYLLTLVSRGNELRDNFVRDNPRGQVVWDRLSSPDYLDSHPVLSVPIHGKHDIDDEEWETFLRELEAARREATSSDPQEFTSQVRRDGTATKQISDADEGAPVDSDLSNQVELASRRDEVAYQNQLWGEHKVSGGSSEIGQWLDYALLGAGAQDVDDNETLSSVDGGMRPGHGILAHSTGFKVDKLPAYCNPPNPCPVGYNPDTLPTPCDENIADTKEFNKAWIYKKLYSGECSCDIEHMWKCPSNSNPEPSEGVDSHSYLHGSPAPNPYMGGQKRSRLVAKKTIQKRSFPWDAYTHPYMHGKLQRKVVKKAGPPPHRQIPAM